MIFLKRFKIFIKKTSVKSLKQYPKDFTEINCLPIGIFLYDQTHNGWGRGIQYRDNRMNLYLDVTKYQHNHLRNNIEFKINLQNISYKIFIKFYLEPNNRYSYICTKKTIRVNGIIDTFIREKSDKHDINGLILKFLPLKDLEI